MVKVCSVPVAARWFAPSVTDACRLQVPVATKLTTPEVTVQILVGLEVVEAVPSPTFV